MTARLVAEHHQPYDRISWQPGGRSLGWWGMTLFITTEALIFAMLLFAYFFLRSQAAEWPLGDVKEPELVKSGIRTVLLLGSSLPVHLADRGIRTGNNSRLVIGVALTLLLSTIFFVGHIEEAHKMWIHHERPDLNAYTSAFWTVTNFHAFHLVVGMGMLVVVLVRAVMGRYDAHHHRGVQLTAMYWHFVDVVWIFVYSSLYLSVVWA